MSYEKLQHHGFRLQDPVFRVIYKWLWYQLFPKFCVRHWIFVKLYSYIFSVRGLIILAWCVSSFSISLVINQPKQNQSFPSYINSLFFSDDLDHISWSSAGQFLRNSNKEQILFSLNVILSTSLSLQSIKTLSFLWLKL